MIISNAVPKAGGHLLYAYLGACGLRKEPGELYADVDIVGCSVVRRPLGGTRKKRVWPSKTVRSHRAMINDLRRDAVVNAHVHDRIRLRGHVVVFIYRHPRNILVSSVRFSLARFNWNPPEKVLAPERIRAGLDETAMRQAIGRCQSFVGWIERADHSVRFEDFVAIPDAARKAAAAIGLTPADPAEVLGDRAPWLTATHRGTWSGRHSNWAEFWDDEIDAEWRRLGGEDVEALYGYD